VEDVIREIDNLNLETVLQHAALASLTCTGRTLGSDKTPFLVAENDENVPVLPDKSPAKTEYVSPAKIDIEPSLSCFPGADAINASIVKRELAEQCKKSVRLQLNQLQEKQQSFRSKLDKQQKEQENLETVNHKALRKEQEILICQKADQLANAHLDAQQREQQALRRQTDQKLQQLALEGVARCQRRFSKKFEGITKLLLSLDKETVQVCAHHNRQLKDLAQQFEQLVSNVKAGNCEQTQYLRTIIKAEQCCRNLDTLEVDMIKQLAEFSELIQQQIKVEEAKRHEEEQRKKLEEKQRLQKEKEEAEARQTQQQQQQQAEEAAKAAAAQAAAAKTEVQPTAAKPAVGAPSADISTSYVHPERLKFYNEILALYQTKVDAVKPLQTEESLKQYRTGCQRAINLPLNAISAVSPQHLSNNFDKLYTFFAGQPVKLLNGASMTINDHPLARDYCLLLMAKKFVSQTETAISSNPQAAFPFASVIVTFWKLLPDFGKIFLAYLYKESPFLVPYVIPQQQGQSPEQYLKMIGYRLTDNELEKPDMYLKRQTGIARLYAAVMITPGRKADGPEHCFGLEEGWRWLAHMVHVKPLPDVSATLIMEILQTLGFELLRTYGKQFVKLLCFIQNTYMPQLAAHDEGGPKTRLEMILGKFLREGQIPQAVGVLPPGFW
ncbi:hypothetical protein KR026_006833, partial [Drosophila bipectinata]